MDKTKTLFKDQSKYTIKGHVTDLSALLTLQHGGEVHSFYGKGRFTPRMVTVMVTIKL